MQEYLFLVERPSPDRAQSQADRTVREQVPPRGRPASPAGSLPATKAHDLAAIYAAHYLDVARWVRGFGANDADVEDLAQEVFIIVGRKLDRFDGRNLRGFLYRITQRTVRDHRRSTWFRRSIRGQFPIEWLILATEPAALHTVDKLHLRRTLATALACMSEKLRTTFILFEIDGYTGEEIARIQSLPVRTVWTRLYYARKTFLRIVTELLPASPGQTEAGPAAASGDTTSSP